MYKVMGSDGKEYGPVSAETLRQWMAERRANGQTRVRLEGSDEWKPLSDWPEFSGAFDTSPRSAPPPPLPMSGGSSSAPAAKTSGMAIASLVLGIFGFTCVTAIVGLVLGILAQVKISRSGGKLKGTGLAIAGIILSGLMMLMGLPIMAGLLLPALAKAKQRAQFGSCVNNAKQVGLAVRLYADENDGKSPPAVNWCDAILPSLPGANVLQCPQRRGQKSGFGLNARIAGRTLSSIPPDTVLLFESSAGWNFTGGAKDVVPRPPHGRNYVFCFADGSAREVPADELPTLRWEP
jgi:hypothetical protein